VRPFGSAVARRPVKLALIESRKSRTLSPQRRIARNESDANQHPLVRFTRPTQFATRIHLPPRAIRRMLIDKAEQSAAGGQA